MMASSTSSTTPPTIFHDARSNEQEFKDPIEDLHDTCLQELAMEEEVIICILCLFEFFITQVSVESLRIIIIIQSVIRLQL